MGSKWGRRLDVIPVKSHMRSVDILDNNHTYIYGKHINHIQVKILYNKYIEKRMDYYVIDYTI